MSSPNATVGAKSANDAPVLLEERLKYFTLPDEPEPPAEEPSGPTRRGPPPRRLPRTPV